MDNKFGSAYEINKAAEELKAKGDEKALVELAIECGIDREDAEDYMDGAWPQLCTPLTAALGKIKAESEALNLQNEFADLKDELVSCLMDNNMRNKIEIGVMLKHKSLAEYMAKIIDKGYEKAITPPKEILAKVTKVPAQYRGQMKTGMPSKAERMAIMMEYFGEKVVVE